MSAAVTRRLQEIAEQGEARRRRMSEIRRQSCLLTDAVRQLRGERERQAGWGKPSAVSRGVSVDTREHRANLDRVAAPASGHVLGQVKELLLEIDSRERERWNEDDTLILICLQSALAAAGRKGYPLRDLHAILDGLRPPDRDT